MTFGSILKTVLGEEQSNGNKFIYERNGHDYYHHYGHNHHHHKSKGKSKSDKKSAILSALSLLAFLFFLNILQNCIREETQTMSPVIMLNYQNKKEESEQMEEYKTEENRRLNKNVAEITEENGNEKVHARKSRSLLQFVEGKTKRREKFIRNFGNSNNWTKELSQITDKDLEDQKLKTLNFSLYRKHLTNQSKNGNDYVGDDKTIELGKAEEIILPVLRRIKKRERSTAEPINFKTGNETTDVPGLFKAYENSLNNVQSTKYKTEKVLENLWFYKNVTENNYHLPGNTTSNILEETNVTQSNVPTTSNHEGTTPRIRRSDAATNEQSIPTTSLLPITEIDLKTYQDTQDYQNINSASSSDETHFKGVAYPVTQQPDIQNYDTIRITTEGPVYYAKTSLPPSYQQPYRGHLKTKYPSNQYKNRNKQQYPMRYNNNNNNHRQPPIRRISNQDPSRVQHDNYYPVAVIARYPPEEEPEFDLLKFFWSLLTSFTKPLTRLMPNFGKEGTDEPQCYELLVCEAQRASKLMGPTAEAFAATIGTLLTWATGEETRQLVIDAIQSGKENTCQQQIKDCDDRSGGKSAMTVIAQALEIKKPTVQRGDAAAAATVTTTITSNS